MPSLLVLEGLHLLCPAPSDAPEAAGANSGTAALVSWFAAALRQMHATVDGRPPLPGGP